MQITQCIADVQQWKEERKRMQREYEEQERLESEQQLKQAQLIKQKIKDDEERMAREQQRLEKTQRILMNAAIKRIQNITSNNDLTQKKMKLEAKKEVIDEQLKSK